MVDGVHLIFISALEQFRCLLKPYANDGRMFLFLRGSNAIVFSMRDLVTKLNTGRYGSHSGDSRCLAGLLLLHVCPSIYCTVSARMPSLSSTGCGKLREGGTALRLPPSIRVSLSPCHCHAIAMPRLVRIPRARHSLVYVMRMCTGYRAGERRDRCRPGQKKAVRLGGIFARFAQWLPAGSLAALTVTVTELPVLAYSSLPLGIVGTDSQVGTL
ncbi:hypothetical protein F4803DRAFT_533709 [Xylaria telfairii]|nr:hypothetical protein F4803DRAFT_533709 [Xylaria telfairii]